MLNFEAKRPPRALRKFIRSTCNWTAVVLWCAERWFSHGKRTHTQVTNTWNTYKHLATRQREARKRKKRLGYVRHKRNSKRRFRVWGRFRAGPVRSVMFRARGVSRRGDYSAPAWGTPPVPRPPLDIPREPSGADPACACAIQRYPSRVQTENDTANKA